MTVRPGKSSVFSLLRKTCNDGDDRTDFSRLFQTDAAVAGKVQTNSKLKVVTFRSLERKLLYRF